MNTAQDARRGTGARRTRVLREAVVVSTTRLAATTVRLVLAGPADFPVPDHADAYVKLLVAAPGVLDGVLPGPVDLEDLRAGTDPDRGPRLRAYTVRHWDADRSRLTLDIVVHGTRGLAGPWAERARPGDRVLLVGPGGAFTPDPGAGFRLCVGDTSAAPAIAACLERLPDDAVGQVWLGAGEPDEAYPLDGPPGVRVSWVHPDRSGPDGDGRGGGLDVPARLEQLLLQAVRGTVFAGEDAECFVHGEAGMVRAVRRHLRVDRGVPVTRLSASGYWRRGVDDEGWRATKRAWQRSTEDDDADAALSAASAVERPGVS